MRKTRSEGLSKESLRTRPRHAYSSSWFSPRLARAVIEVLCTVAIWDRTCIDEPSSTRLAVASIWKPFVWKALVSGLRGSRASMSGARPVPAVRHLLVDAASCRVSVLRHLAPSEPSPFLVTARVGRGGRVATREPFTRPGRGSVSVIPRGSRSLPETPSDFIFSLPAPGVVRSRRVSRVRPAVGGRDVPARPPWHSCHAGGSPPVTEDSER